MNKIDKIILKMSRNPRDWRIDDLKVIAQRYELDIRQPGTSHVTFTSPETGKIITVPAHKPIKPIYIKKFFALLDELAGETND